MNGDQFSQTDRRTVMGLNVSHTFRIASPYRHRDTFGVQTRYDDIDVGLFNTVAREILSTVRDDMCRKPARRLRPEHHALDRLAAHHAAFAATISPADVDSDTPANSGNASGIDASPKVGLVFGPFDATEFYLNAGTGFHSNDARGATIAVDPNDKVTPLAGAAAGALQGRRGRRSHQGDRRARKLGGVLRPRLRL